MSAFKVVLLVQCLGHILYSTATEEPAMRAGHHLKREEPRIEPSHLRTVDAPTGESFISKKVDDTEVADQGVHSDSTAQREAKLSIVMERMKSLAERAQKVCTGSSAAGDGDVTKPPEIINMPEGSRLFQLEDDTAFFTGRNGSVYKFKDVGEALKGAMVFDLPAKSSVDDLKIKVPGRTDVYLFFDQNYMPYIGDVTDFAQDPVWAVDKDFIKYSGFVFGNNRKDGKGDIHYGPLTGWFSHLPAMATTFVVMAKDCIGEITLPKLVDTTLAIALWPQALPQSKQFPKCFDSGLRAPWKGPRSLDPSFEYNACCWNNRCDENGLGGTSLGQNLPSAGL